jgi:hypothetical protein
LGQAGLAISNQVGHGQVYVGAVLMQQGKPFAFCSGPKNVSQSMYEEEAMISLEAEALLRRKSTDFFF